jgi:peptidoglycan-associated lipoprotein
MHLQRFVVSAAAVLVALTAGACKRGPRPEEQQAAQAAQAAAQRATADSARAAERTRLATAITPVIHFNFDRSAIRADARPVMDSKVQTLKANPTVRIRISGHCDSRGPASYNQALGLRRAQAAKQYLVRAGIDAGRIDVVSMGESQPVDPGHTRAAYAANRRAEFEVLP